MKKLSLTFFMLFGFLAFSTSLQAQKTTYVNAKKTNCQKPCTQATQANAWLPYSTLFAVAASEEKANTPNTMTAKKKAECQKVCTKTAATKANCDPKDCPPECLPPNCKIVS